MHVSAQKIIFILATVTSLTVHHAYSLTLQYIVDLKNTFSQIFRIENYSVGYVDCWHHLLQSQSQAFFTIRRMSNRIAIYGKKHNDKVFKLQRLTFLYIFYIKSIETFVSSINKFLNI